MSTRFLPAGADDEVTLLELMREFHAIEGLPHDREIARRALTQLREDPSLGRVYLVREAEEVVGYVVLGFGFSVEFHGRDALIDELYVREPARGRGLGSACLEWVEEVCRGEGIRALHLEVDHSNLRGQRLYRRLGYRDHDRYLMTKWVAGEGGK